MGILHALGSDQGVNWVYKYLYMNPQRRSVVSVSIHIVLLDGSLIAIGALLKPINLLFNMVAM